MPNYDYECAKCNIVFECFQSMNDEPFSVCTHPEGCKHPRAKGKVTRLIGTGAGIIFKGSGFYETDYRSNEYKEAAKKDTEKSSKSDSSDKKTDKSTKAESSGVKNSQKKNEKK